MAFMTPEQLAAMGFRRLGENVLISDRASIYGASAISLGNNVRIDDYCVISASQKGIVIGDYVHIAVFCSLIGQEHIEMEDFAGLSSRVSIYSSSDDYSGASLTNPTVPDEYKNVQHGPVHLKRHVIVGAGSIILPDVTLEVGSGVGALSLVTRSVPEFTLVSGIPAKRIADRKRDLLEHESALRAAAQAANA